ncbi:uncharacterized protein LOC114308921 [Camellia sinensis]|uniref:uncharacterized protein LOC114308921 n=1 Tax=Camellia sinensis TaxID=4442 RepID=UPI0010358D22|nr:uncharacterized protein LOC114308921 [Camellia sinensis]
MPRSTTPKQQQWPPTKTLFRCGRFELRVTKIRRRKVTPSISCGRFDLLCTKNREARIHLQGPPFTVEACKTKQQTGHPPASIASCCGENDVEDAEHNGKQLVGLRKSRKAKIQFLSFFCCMILSDITVLIKMILLLDHGTDRLMLGFCKPDAFRQISEFIIMCKLTDLPKSIRLTKSQH